MLCPIESPSLGSRTPAGLSGQRHKILTPEVRLVARLKRPEQEIRERPRHLLARLGHRSPVAPSHEHRAPVLSLPAVKLNHQFRAVARLGETEQVTWLPHLLAIGTSPPFYRPFGLDPLRKGQNSIKQGTFF